MANKDGTKSGGRGPGTPNNSTAEVRALLEKLKCDPIKFMAKVVNGTIKQDAVIDVAGEKKVVKVPPSFELRVKCADSLAGFVWPKRKAVELTSEDGESLAPQTIRVIFGNEGEDDG